MKFRLFIDTIGIEKIVDNSENKLKNCGKSVIHRRTSGRIIGPRYEQKLPDKFPFWDNEVVRNRWSSAWSHFPHP